MSDYNENAFEEGFKFFKPKYATMDLEHWIDHIARFEDFEALLKDDLLNENLLLADYLYYLLDRYHMSANKISQEIGKTHSYVRKIIGGHELNPSRDVLLAICVRLGTTVEEAQILLRYSGKQPLYARRKRDAIIWYALKKHQSLTELNIYLYEHGYKSLSKLIERNK
ncbi:MAG: hypothetical protein Q4B73_10310 [Lachnospiraceae bacterium]|nr:hypothetical protein [Lachnospiraceae bacterium]